MGIPELLHNAGLGAIPIILTIGLISIKNQLRRYGKG